MVNKSNICPTLILLFFAILIFSFSAFSSWAGDEIEYRYFWNDPNGYQGELNSISDIFFSQINHWHTGNGRFVAHVLVQLFCAFLGPVAFGIANALIYAALTLLIMSFVGASLKNTKALLSVIFLIVICFSTKMMPSCQISYIWGFVVALTFVKAFFTKRILSAWYWLPLFLFALFAGNFHEGVNFGIGGALAIYALRNLKKITTQQWVLFVGFAIGGLLNCLSPGSIRRANSIDIPFYVSLFNLFHHALGIYVLVISSICAICKKRLSFNEIYRRNSFFINAAICALIVNLVISIGTSRQVYAISLFCIIVGLRLLMNKSLSTGWLIVAGIIACIHLIIQAYNTVAMRQFTSDVNCQLHAADSLARQNDDARIFINLYPQSICWHSFLDSYVENNSYNSRDTGNMRKLRIDLSHRYPSTQISIFPKELLNLDTVTQQSGILKISNETYILYKKSFLNDNMTVTAQRTIGVPGTPLKTKYKPATYNMDAIGTVIYEYNGYKAMLISQYDYSPFIQISSIYKNKQ